MFAMIRHYRMAAGSIDDLMHKVDSQFVDQLRDRLGILAYQAIDAGEGRIVTITLFETEQQLAGAEAAAEGVRHGLAEFRVEQTDALSGEVMVSRAAEMLLTAVHH